MMPIYPVVNVPRVPLVRAPLARAPWPAPTVVRASPPPVGGVSEGIAKARRTLGKVRDLYSALAALLGDEKAARMVEEAEESVRRAEVGI